MRLCTCAHNCLRVRAGMRVAWLPLSEGSSPAMPARMLLLCLPSRSSWLTTEGARGRRRHSAASSGGRAAVAGTVGVAGGVPLGAVSPASVTRVETAASSPVRKSCWCCRIRDKREVGRAGCGHSWRSAPRDLRKRGCVGLTLAEGRMCLCGARRRANRGALLGLDQTRRPAIVASESGKIPNVRTGS